MRNNQFSPESLALSDLDLDALLNRSKPLPRHRRGELFLRGPIPWSWIRVAGLLPGKALLVGMWLWKDARCKRSRTVRFNCRWPTAPGTSDDTVRRALRALEKAGLVAIAHEPGKCLQVTLLDVPLIGSTRSGD
jgi:hypothetical protein